MLAVKGNQDCLETLPKVETWAGLQEIGMVESQRDIEDKVCLERRFYITSFGDDVKKFAQATRQHWGVEKSHIIKSSHSIKNEYSFHPKSV